MAEWLFIFFIGAPLTTWAAFIYNDHNVTPFQTEWCVWWVETVPGRVGWRSSTTATGGRCATTTGPSSTQRWSADSWATGTGGKNKYLKRRTTSESLSCSVVWYYLCVSLHRSNYIFPSAVSYLFVPNWFVCFCVEYFTLGGSLTNLYRFSFGPSCIFTHLLSIFVWCQRNKWINR